MRPRLACCLLLLTVPSASPGAGAVGSHIARRPAKRARPPVQRGPGAAATACGSNNGGCLPDTKCMIRNRKVACDYHHTCPRLAQPANGVVSCPNIPGTGVVQQLPSYSLVLVEGDLKSSIESRSECVVGCRPGYAALAGFTGKRYCTATGWSDVTPVRCAAQPPCAPARCSNHGSCQSQPNGASRCTCSRGWAGELSP